MTYAQNMQGQGYISARGRATAIVVLVSIQLAVLVAVLGFSAASLSGSGVDLPMLTIAGGLETFEMLLFLATFIVYMTWVYRSIANLPALGSMSCRFTPGGAVWSFFIPFVNLVRGHQVMATIWQESQPPAVGEKGFYLPRSTAIVGWWWGLLLAMRILGTVVERWNPSGIQDVREMMSVDMFVNGLRVATAVLFLLMVRRAQQRQDAQWDDLERQRNVPLPTADALR